MRDHRTTVAGSVAAIAAATAQALPPGSTERTALTVLACVAGIAFALFAADAEPASAAAGKWAGILTASAVAYGILAYGLVVLASH